MSNYENLLNFYESLEDEKISYDYFSPSNDIPKNYKEIEKNELNKTNFKSYIIYSYIYKPFFSYFERIKKHDLEEIYNRVKLVSDAWNNSIEEIQESELHFKVSNRDAFPKELKFIVMLDEVWSLNNIESCNYPFEGRFILGLEALTTKLYVQFLEGLEVDTQYFLYNFEHYEREGLGETIELYFEDFFQLFLSLNDIEKKQFLGLRECRKNNAKNIKIQSSYKLGLYFEPCWQLEEKYNYKENLYKLNLLTQRKQVISSNLPIIIEQQIHEPTIFEIIASQPISSNTSNYYENLRREQWFFDKERELADKNREQYFKEMELQAKEYEQSIREKEINVNAKEKMHEIKEFAFEIHSKNERQMIEFLQLSMEAKFDKRDAEMTKKDTELTKRDIEQIKQETEILKKANELQSQVALFEVEKNKLLLTAYEHHLKNENEKLDLRSQSYDNQRILDEAKRIEENAKTQMQIYELQTNKDKLELQRMTDNLHNEKAKQIITDMLFNLKDKESGIKDQLQRLQYGTMEQTILFKEQKHSLELSRFDLEKEEMNIKSEKMDFQRSVDDMINQFFGGGRSWKDASKFFGRMKERDRQLKSDERYNNERENRLDAMANQLSHKQDYLDHRDRNLDEREKNLDNKDKK